ncbi:hypothetical protein JCM10296v2_006232 [Rhodotorula toruloides]
MATATTTTVPPFAAKETLSLPLKADAAPSHAQSASAAAAALPTPPLTRPSSPSLSRKAAAPYARPSTHHLDEHRHAELTPAIGLQFTRELQVRDVLRMPEDDPKRQEMLKELAYLISFHGVCVFPAQDLTPDELSSLALALGKASGAPADSSLHIHPTAELGENGRPTVGAISNVAGAMGRQINFKDERSELASQGIHSDISFEQRPARYSALRMRTLPPTGGDTMFYSSYAHASMLSPAMFSMLSSLSAIHSGRVFRDQARRFGFDLHLGPRGAPENVGDDFEAVHPVIRTNAVTGFHALNVNPTFTERIVGLTFDESRAILDYLYKVQAQAHDAQVRIRWEKDTLCIWDNAAVLHAATFDFKGHERSGDRTVCVGEKPFFDAENGTTRKEALGSVV